MASNYGNSRTSSKFNYGGLRTPILGSSNRLYQQQGSQRRASKHQLAIEPPVSYRFFHRETRDSIFSDIPKPANLVTSEPQLLNQNRRDSAATEKKPIRMRKLGKQGEIVLSNFPPFLNCRYNDRY